MEACKEEQKEVVEMLLQRPDIKIDLRNNVSNLHYRTQVRAYTRALARVHMSVYPHALRTHTLSPTLTTNYKHNTEEQRDSTRYMFKTKPWGVSEIIFDAVRFQF